LSDKNRSFESQLAALQVRVDQLENRQKNLEEAMENWKQKINAKIANLWEYVKMKTSRFLNPGKHDYDFD